MSHKNKKVVQDDVFVSSLSNIIQKNFFPDLDRIDAQYDYLVALEQGDITALKSASERLDKFPQPQHSELNQYLSNHTTEDNASFEELLKKMNEKRIQKRKWIQGQAIRHSLSSIQSDKSQYLQINDKSNNKIESSHSDTLTMATMLFPQESSNTNIMNQTRQSNIQYSNTRLTNNTLTNLLKQSTQIEHHYYSILQEYIPSDRTIVNTESQNPHDTFVPTTPTIHPTQVPIMTWGNIASTPIPLKDHIQDTPKFKIPSTPVREQIAHSLADKEKQKKSKTEQLKILLNKRHVNIDTQLRRAYRTPKKPT